MDFHTYIQMGGYALHVWGSYALVLLVMGGFTIHAVVKHERLKNSTGAKQ
ncbi:MAG: heme exporter protein CcmD [Alphaproteobacteria bacterium]|nr:heme exporter protein CcmD [Alphaproteobacteria bacterium]